MLRVAFDAQGQSRTEIVMPFFEPEKDPLMRNGIDCLARFTAKPLCGARWP